MHDRPDAGELAAAVKHFLETELMPSLTDARMRYQTLVAAHVLGIVERERSSEEADLAWEAQWLAQVLGEKWPSVSATAALRDQVRDANVRLCAALRQGKFDEPALYRSLIGGLRESVQRKLRVANPRLAATSASAK